jgi:hypothetical protein
MIYPTDLLHPSPAPHFKTFQVFLICCPAEAAFNKKKTLFTSKFVLNLRRKLVI